MIVKPYISYAKINLFLYVTNKRSDGYHELYTLMVPVSLCDDIHITFGRQSIAIECSHPDIPINETNLAYMAGKEFFDTTKIKDRVSINIHKRIPISAGLGGGSSNAATVLNALNAYYHNPLSNDQLMALGLKIGADVPFCLYQKPAIATGVGEILTPYTEPLPSCIIIVYPGFHISTQQIFKKLNFKLTNHSKKNKMPLFNHLNLHWDSVLWNDLESVAIAEYSYLSEVKQTLIEAGIQTPTMSGSGSSFFGICDSMDKAKQIEARLKVNQQWQIFTCSIITSQKEIKKSKD